MYAVDALARAKARSHHLVEYSKAAAGGRNGRSRAALDPGYIASGPGGVFGGQMDNSLAAEQLEKFEGWVYSAVKAIAQRIAAQPIRVGYMVDYDPEEEVGPKGRPASTVLKSMLNRGTVPGWFRNFNANDLELVEQHPILSAIGNPNPVMVQWMLLYVTICHLELTGRAYWYVYDREGRKEIWPLAPHWVVPLHDQGMFSKFMVTPKGTVSGGFEVNAEDVCYFAYPDPQDPFGGATSGLQANYKAVAADESIQSCQKNFFENGIFPGLAIVAGRHPEASTAPGQRQALTKEQRLELRQAIAAHYRSVQKFNDPLILDAMIEDVRKISNSANELDFLASGRYTKERVLQGFGVSPIILGDAGNANRASAAVADQVFCSATVNPKIELISQVMTKVLPGAFRLDEEGLVIWIEPARANDTEQRSNDIRLLADKGSIRKNELRTEFGFPPLEADEGGEELVGETGPQFAIQQPGQPAGPAPVDQDGGGPEKSHSKKNFVAN